MSNEHGGGVSSDFPEARTPAERIADAFATRFRGVPWEPPEIVPAAIIAAVLLFALGEIAASIVLGVTSGGLGVADSLLQATAWAQPVLVALLLGSTLLSWDQVKDRCDDLDFYAASDDDLAADEIDSAGSLVRLFRLRFLASSSFVATLVSTAAAIGFEVGVVMERLPHVTGAPNFEPQTWAALIEGGGNALAVAVLALATFVIGRRIHRRVAETLRMSTSELETNEIPSSETTP